MSRPFHATTPFPNALLDEAMPYLKDTEWRVLCVIVRQTLGWRLKDGKARKTSDWLTQSQLVEKTGRDRAALSRAIDVLVRRRLIEVKDARGRMLLSPRERRHCKGHLFFGLYPGLQNNEGRQAQPPQFVKSEYQTLSSNSLLDDQSAKSEYHRAPKANTTKETLTKENVTKELLKEFSNEFLSELSTAPETETKFSNQAREFIALFVKLHQEAENLHRDAGNGNADTRLTPDSAASLETLLDSRSWLYWSAVLQDFFASDSGFIVRRNHSLEAFLGSCHIFLARRSLPGVKPNTRRRFPR